MRQILAFGTKEEYVKYQGIIERLTQKLKEYEYILKSRFQLKEPPKGILWTSEELATTVFSDVPIPAFTDFPNEKAHAGRRPSSDMG